MDEKEEEGLDNNKVFQKRFNDEVKKREEAAKLAKAKADDIASFVKVAEKVKSNVKDKAEMQKLEKRMIGDEAKYMCDKCDYTGRSNRSVKMHWGKKHRREAQEESDDKMSGKPTKETESKKLKADEDKTKVNLLYLYDD